MSDWELKLMTKNEYFVNTKKKLFLLVMLELIAFLIFLCGIFIVFYLDIKKDIKEEDFLWTVIMSHLTFIVFFGSGYFINKIYITHILVSLEQCLIKKVNFFKIFFYNTYIHKENRFIKKSVLRQLYILIGVGAIITCLFLYNNFQAGLYVILYAFMGYFVALSFIFDIIPLFLLAKKGG